VLVAAAPVIWTPLAAAVYAAGSFICHQIPERSFHLNAFQLPVCARCLGLYGGGAFGSIVGAAGLSRREHWRWRVPVRRQRWIAAAIAAAPTLVTFVLEWGFGWRVSNATRAIAALPLGGAVAFVVVNALATLHYEQCAPTRPIGSSQPPTST